MLSFPPPRRCVCALILISIIWGKTRQTQPASKTHARAEHASTGMWAQPLIPAAVLVKDASFWPVLNSHRFSNVASHSFRDQIS